jgi:2-(1,2-epoxy-1,2-dihydrophenyl)acetyl-CoA isomerase
MEDQAVWMEEVDGVAVITLNQPDKLNALSMEVKRLLVPILERVTHDANVRVVLLRGNGRAFCAGGDISAMGNRSTIDAYEIMSEVNRMIGLLEHMSKPVIAAIHGPAAGAGLSLAMACDLVYATEEAKFSLSFKNVGLVPDGGAHYYLVRLVGPRKSKELIFTGKFFTAQQAKEWGIVNEIIPHENWYETVLDTARNLAQGPTKAYEVTKKLINQSLHLTLDEVLEHERLAQSMLQQTEDHKEGIAAFREKRRPLFKGI